MLSVGVGSALAWLFLKSSRRVPAGRNVNLPKPAKTAGYDDIYGV